MTNRSIFHTKKSEPYHLGNSIRGVLKAIRGKFWAIDLDMQITKDGVIVGTHWGRTKKDGFHDPRGIVDTRKPIRELTWEQVSHLRAKGDYRIQPIDRLIEECGTRIVAYLEPKADVRFEQDWPWRVIKQSATAHKATIRVRSIRNLGGRGAGTRRIEAARRAGFVAKTIY